MSDLKPEWRVFSEQYVIDWNGTRAYMVAYPKSSYEAAMSSASDLLRNPKIQDYIKEIQEDLGKLAGVSALRNILELKKLAYTNLSDFKDGWLTQKEFEELDESTLAALSEIQYTTKKIGEMTENIVKFKLHDKLKAIEGLNKMLGYDAPTVNINENKNTDNGYTPELKEKHQKLKDKLKQEAREEIENEMKGKKK